MITEALKGFARLFWPPVPTDWHKPAEVVKPVALVAVAPLPFSDGRVFVWIGTPAAAKVGSPGSEMQAQIIRQPGARLNILASRTLEPSEYEMSLNELMAKYPAPVSS